jgi:hypothetical protein
LVNGRLARRQHVQQVKHEREVLRTTLRAELGVLRDTFVHRIEVIAAAQQDGSTGVLIPIDTMTDAYPLLLDRVGLLSVEEARAVMVAYLLVRQMPARIRLLQPKNEL